MIVLPDESDINYFISPAENTGRSSNDHNNKIRENIIRCMYHIDDEYFSHQQFGTEWFKIKNDFDTKIRIICPNYKSYKIIHKAGRKNNYDYDIYFYNEFGKEIANEKLEFKFNASCIDEAPQFVSPMKPSQYLSQPFEEYYYDYYLVPLLQKFSLQVPERSEYLKSIHGTSPICVKDAQLLYYQGCKQSSKYTGTEQACEFYQSCIDTSKECIEKFIATTDLDIHKLTQYLISTQNTKKYLLYKNGEFNIQTTNDDDYIIVSYSKNSQKSRYEAVTKTGKKINILLRWKNGNGIAYPAFQIS
jgi:hypothetical protein